MVLCYVVQSCKFLYIVLSGGGSCRPEGQGKRSMLLGIMEVRVLRKSVNGFDFSGNKTLKIYNIKKGVTRSTRGWQPCSKVPVTFYDKKWLSYPSA